MIKLKSTRLLLVFILLLQLSSTILASSHDKAVPGNGSPQNWDEINQLGLGELFRRLKNSSLLDDILEQLPDELTTRVYYIATEYINCKLALQTLDVLPTNITLDGSIKLYKKTKELPREKNMFPRDEYQRYIDSLYLFANILDKTDPYKYQNLIILTLEDAQQLPGFEEVDPVRQRYMYQMLNMAYLNASNNNWAIEYGKKALFYYDIDLKTAASLHRTLSEAHLSDGAGLQKNIRKVLFHAEESFRLKEGKKGATRSRALRPAAPETVRRRLLEIKEERQQRETASRSTTKKAKASPTRQITSTTTRLSAPAAAAACSSAAAPTPNLTEQMRQQAAKEMARKESKKTKKAKRVKTNTAAEAQTDDDILNEFASQPAPVVKIPLAKRHRETIEKIFSNDRPTIKMLEICKLLNELGAYRPGNGSHSVYKLTAEDIAALSKGIDDTADEAVLSEVVEDSLAQAVYLVGNDLIRIPQEEEDDPEEAVDDGAAAAAAAPARRQSTATRNQTFTLPLRPEVAHYLRLQLRDKLTALGITPETVIRARE